MTQSRIVKNSVWGGISAGVRMIGGIVTTLLAIRLLGSDRYGYLAMINGVTLPYLALNVGFFTALMRRLVGCQGSKRADAGILIRSGFFFCFFATIIILIISFYYKKNITQTFIYWGSDYLLEIDIINAFIFSIISLCIRLYGRFFVSVIEGCGRFDLAAKGQIVQPVFSILFLAGMVIYSDSYSLDFVAKVIMIATFLELIFVVVFFIYIKNTYFVFNKIYYMEYVIAMRSLLIEGFKLQGAGLLSQFVDPLNKYLLNVYAGPSSVTLYELSMKAITSVRGLFTAAFRSFFQFANKVEIVGDQYVKIINYVISPIAIFHSTVAIMLSFIVNFDLIDSSNDIIVLYLVMMPSSVGISIVSPLYNVLIGIGDTDFIVRLHLRLALISAFFSLAFVPFWGLWGAGVGVTFATLYNAVAVFRRFNAKVGFSGCSKFFSYRLQLRICFVFLCGLGGAVFLVVATKSSHFSFHLAWVGFLLILGCMLLKEPLIVKMLRMRNNY